MNYRDILDGQARADVEKYVPRKPLFTISETAKLANRSPRWVARFMEGGVLPFIMLGGARMIPRAAIVALLTGELKP
jgi:hypothetical protein